MIDLTPLDVRKKRGDFRKSMRGYDPQEVDTFLDLVAMRMEELVKDTIGLRERAELLQVQVDTQSSRERAVQEALVTAQAVREDMREQSRREAGLALREAEVEAGKVISDADRVLEERRVALEEVERKRVRFLRAFRALLERELDVVVVEEGRSPLDDTAVELELSGGRRGGDRADPLEGAEGRAEPTADSTGGGLAGGEGEDGADAVGAGEADGAEAAPRDANELWLSGLGGSAVARSDD